MAECHVSVNPASRRPQLVQTSTKQHTVTNHQLTIVTLTNHIRPARLNNTQCPITSWQQSPWPITSGWHTTKCGVGRICRADRHWSVLITWEIRILSFSLAQLKHQTNPNPNPNPNPTFDHWSANCHRSDPPHSPLCRMVLVLDDSG